MMSTQQDYTVKEGVSTEIIGVKILSNETSITWNPKRCFNWMIPNLYLGNGCFTKHPFKSGCLGFQVYILFAIFSVGIYVHDAKSQIHSVRQVRYMLNVGVTWCI